MNMAGGSGAGREGVWSVQKCGTRQVTVCPSPWLGQWMRSGPGSAGRLIPGLPEALKTYNLPVLSADMR